MIALDSRFRGNDEGTAPLHAHHQIRLCTSTTLVIDTAFHYTWKPSGRQANSIRWEACGRTGVWAVPIKSTEPALWHSWQDMLYFTPGFEPAETRDEPNSACFRRI